MKLHRLEVLAACPSCGRPCLVFSHEEPTGDLHHCAACGADVHHEAFVENRRGRPVSGCRLIGADDCSIRPGLECAGRLAEGDPPRCA